MSQAERSPRAAMFDIITGFQVSRAVYLAARLELADRLATGPQTVDALAQATGTRPPLLARLLRALAGIGVVTELEPGRFALTPLGGTLRGDTPDSLKGLVLLELGDEHYASWGALLHTLKTGETAFDHLYGMDVWRYYAEHPEAGRRFDEAMTSLTGSTDRAVADAYDLSGVPRVVDIAGGQGRLLATLLKARPGLRGVLFDAPAVVAGAAARLEAEGVLDRCTLIPGDFFASVPEGAGVFLLKHILHDWEDGRAVRILENCRKAMTPDSRLLVIEMVLPAGDTPHPGKLVDLSMAALTGGCERTEAEYRHLLDAAGFRLKRVISTRSIVSILEAVPDHG